MADRYTPGLLMDAADALEEAVEVGKPGTNWLQVSPEARKKIGPIVRHYMKEAHPFSACVRDNTKRFGPERAKRVCAVVKDMGERRTTWRKGRSRIREAMLGAALWTVGTEAGLTEDDFGAWAAACVEMELREGDTVDVEWLAGLIEDGVLDQRDLEQLVADGVMTEAVLTAAKRKKLPKKSFALPGGRYPIHDEAHARNALARVAQHGSPEEKKRVRRAVKRKYPGMVSERFEPGLFA